MANASHKYGYILIEVRGDEQTKLLRVTPADPSGELFTALRERFETVPIADPGKFTADDDLERN